jgi:hypothetical protein
MMQSLCRAGRWVLWYLKQATGEAKWDEYIERCAEDGTTPTSRREFERHRASHQEHNLQSHCC